VPTEYIFRQANEWIRQVAEECFIDPARLIENPGPQSADGGVAKVVGLSDDYVVVEVGAHDHR
jgi:hypothetical protein